MSGQPQRGGMHPQIPTAGHQNGSSSRPPANARVPGATDGHSSSTSSFSSSSSSSSSSSNPDELLQRARRFLQGYHGALGLMQQHAQAAEANQQAHAEMKMHRGAYSEAENRLKSCASADEANNLRIAMRRSQEMYQTASSKASNSEHSAMMYARASEMVKQNMNGYREAHDRYQRETGGGSSDGKVDASKASAANVAAAPSPVNTQSLPQSVSHQQPSTMTPTGGAGDATDAARAAEANPNALLNPNPNLTCHYCKEIGHKRPDCPKRMESKLRCRKCNELGHVRRNCPLRKEDGAPDHAGENADAKANPLGEDAAQGPNNDGDGKGIVCHECGEPGHVRPACPEYKRKKEEKKRLSAAAGGAEGKPKEKDVVCHRCGEAGHIRPNCTQPEAQANVTCHHCGEKGHVKPQCPTYTKADKAAEKAQRRAEKEAAKQLLLQQQQQQQQEQEQQQKRQGKLASNEADKRDHVSATTTTATTEKYV